MLYVLNYFASSLEVNVTGNTAIPLLPCSHVSEVH